MSTGGSGSATLNRGPGCDGSGGTYQIKLSPKARKALLKAIEHRTRAVRPRKGTRFAGIKTGEACETKGGFWLIPKDDTYATEPVCNRPGLDSIKVTLPRGANCKGRTSTVQGGELPASVEKELLAAAIKARQARLRRK